MASSSTAENLCNLALRRMGQLPITSIDGSDKVSKICSEFYDDVRLDVLQAHSWNEAIVRAKLAKLFTPLWGFSNSYLMPVDFVRFAYAEEMKYQFRIETFNEKKVISSDQGSMNIAYVKDLDDVGLMSPKLRRCISLLLASEMSIALTGDLNMKNLMLQEYFTCMAESRYEDLRSGPNDQLVGTTWLDARFGDTSKLAAAEMN